MTFNDNKLLNERKTFANLLHFIGLEVFGWYVSSFNLKSLNSQSSVFRISSLFHNLFSKHFLTLSFYVLHHTSGDLDGCPSCDWWESYQRIWVGLDIFSREVGRCMSSIRKTISLFLWLLSTVLSLHRFLYFWNWCERRTGEDDDGGNHLSWSSVSRFLRSTTSDMSSRRVPCLVPPLHLWDRFPRLFLVGRVHSIGSVNWMGVFLRTTFCP